MDLWNRLKKKFYFCINHKTYLIWLTQKNTPNVTISWDFFYTILTFFKTTPPKVSILSKKRSHIPYCAKVNQKLMLVWRFNTDSLWMRSLRIFLCEREITRAWNGSENSVFPARFRNEARGKHILRIFRYALEWSNISAFWFFEIIEHDIFAYRTIVLCNARFIREFAWAFWKVDYHNLWNENREVESFEFEWWKKKM